MSQESSTWSISGKESAVKVDTEIKAKPERLLRFVVDLGDSGIVDDG